MVAFLRGRGERRRLWLPACLPVRNHFCRRTASCTAVRLVSISLPPSPLVLFAARRAGLAQRTAAGRGGAGRRRASPGRALQAVILTRTRRNLARSARPVERTRFNDSEPQKSAGVSVQSTGTGAVFTPPRMTGLIAASSCPATLYSPGCGQCVRWGASRVGLGRSHRGPPWAAGRRATSTRGGLGCHFPEGVVAVWGWRARRARRSATR